MDDDDFRTLIELLKARLRAVGADDIADTRHYRDETDEDEEPRLLAPQKLLVEMLRAFDRRLASEDRNVYRDALDRMGQTLRGEGPKRAVLVLTGEVDREAEEIDLGRAPDLSLVRKQVQLLIDRIADSRLLPPRSLG